ncbi:lectin [Pseudoxanthomonas mexicana]|uniref:Lectin n=1 Tax=Pseudoxanthomonas mexicana TaxID=128785 RepID=A0ABX6RCX3_PSEMX|nr:lectin [Pseudoxanthomonas mexicana]QLQ27179.1 MAG: lectin [Pseudoxanthomonas sp.]QND79834.1 lectin [Pseudoxanthomonas mexicana]
MKSLLPLVMAVTLLSACQRDPAVAPATEPQTTATATPMAEAPAPTPAADDTAAPAGPVSQASFLGYGDMMLGSTVDEARAAWGGELNGAPMEGTTCHYLWPKWISRPADFAFMMEDGRFVRYDVGTDKETAPGGGKVGMSVEELQKLYGGALKASPHKYTQGGQYLSMDAGDVAPTRLVFEVDAAGKVTSWRVGLSPQVEYVEGCS